MSGDLVPALTRLGSMQHTYHDALGALQGERRELRRIKRAIRRQVKPLVPLAHYFKKDWTSLSDLLDEQAEVVSVVGETLTDMAVTCAEDREVLLGYVATLEARLGTCESGRSTLEETLLATSKQTEGGLLQQLQHGLYLMDLQGKKKRTVLRLQNTEKYAAEITRLLPVTLQVHHVFSGAAETVEDWAAHLQATSETYAKLIAFGRTSAALRDVLTTIDQNSAAVYTAVEGGVTAIAGLFRRLKVRGYMPSVKLLEKTP